MIKYRDGRRCHVFECAASRCKGRNGRYVCRFLDKGDCNSTSNLLRHAKVCWGTEAVEAATSTRDLGAARGVLEKTMLKNGDITTEFKRIGKGKVTYRHTQHTTKEARYEPLAVLLLSTFSSLTSELELRSSDGFLRTKGPSRS